VDVRPLRILSYNIHGQAHLFDRRYLERIARVIAEVQPDAVGLQEVHRGGWKARSEDQAETLGKLTGMAVAFGPSITARHAAFGNAVLTAGELRASEVVPLHAPGEPRTLLSTRIALKGHPVGEISFHVTHLAAWGRWGRSARGQQSAALLEQIRHSRKPFVLVGDLNAVPGAPELEPLMAGEMFQLCGDAVVCTHRVLRRRIDYVFADPGWRTLSERVVRSGPSDHWPVLVELERSA
jgi:endonuclease/exonuclease/phosphatase family metal-dependent hydrolase